MIKHEDTTRGDNECAITEDDCAIRQRVHSTSSLTQGLLNDAQRKPKAIMNRNQIRKAIIATELGGLHKEIL